MARKSMTTLKSEAESRLADNQVGAISPADVRETRVDFLDTVTPAYAAVTIDPGVTGVSIGTAFQDFTEWNATVIDTSEFSINLTTGVITLNEPMVVDFTINVTAEGPNNAELTMQTVFSGSTFSYSVSQTMRGSGRPISLNFTGLYDGNTGDTIKVQVANDTGTDSYNFPKGAFICKLVPLINDPV